MTAPLVLSQPGIYDDVPDRDYHADPVPGGSLSSTGARLLLPPSCPARYRYWADNRQGSTRVFDLGRATHSLLFGVGPEIVVIPADNYRTKAAQEAQRAAREAGQPPLLEWEMEQVRAMVAAVRSHPLASALLHPDRGQAEQTLIWEDRDTGVMCRARLDWLSTHTSANRRIVVDYKTCVSADPETLGKAMWNHGYHIQGAWYRDGIRALELAPETAFVFIAQEKDPPYLTTLFEPDIVALRWGSRLAERARRSYRNCVEANRWPAYTDRVIPVALPHWAESQLEITPDPTVEEDQAR